jgi:glycine cleavage system transcriptional repressor
MAHVAVSAIGSDRPGIVAAVTGVIVRHGCNLEDTTMSILRGHFAMMLVVAVPADVTAESLESALAPVATALELVVVVRPIDDGVPESPDGTVWTVSVYGADRPGIVYQVAAFLASAGVNIVDLTTRVIGEAERPVYAMFLDVTVPDSSDLDRWQAGLAELAAELGVSCSARPADSDIL